MLKINLESLWIMKGSVMLLKTYNDIKKSTDFMSIINNFENAKTIGSMFNAYNQLAAWIKIAFDSFKQSIETKSLFSDKYFDGFDFQVPMVFLINNTISSVESKINSTMHFVAVMNCYESLEEISPLQEVEKITSSYATDSNGNPIDITNIFKTVNVILRKIAIESSLKCYDPDFKPLIDDYLINLAMISNNPFDHSGNDIETILIKDMVKFSLGLGELFPQIFYDQIYENDHNSEAFYQLNLKSEPVRKMIIDILNYRKLKLCLAKIDRIALDITLYLDQWGLGVSEEADTSPNIEYGGPLMPGPNLVNIGSIFDVTKLSDINVGFHKTSSEINGESFIVEYKPSLNQPKNYESKSKAVAPYVSKLTKEITRIYSSNEKEYHEDFQISGDISPTDYYRVKGDVRIFTDTFTMVNPESIFYCMILIDNSCSINDNKKKIMGSILTLFVNTLISHPDKFVHLAAYAQHSSGNRVVTLRRLIDSPVSSISDPSSILHLTSSGVNYDPYAAHEIVTSHSQYFGRISRPLLIVIGDTWPVSQTGKDVKEETRTIFNILKTKYPSLITMNMTVDPNYDPSELYDFFVSISSGDALDKFVKGFSSMIENFVRKEP